MATGTLSSGAADAPPLLMTVADESERNTKSPPPCGDGLACLWLVVFSGQG